MSLNALRPVRGAAATVLAVGLLTACGADADPETDPPAETATEQTPAPTGTVPDATAGPDRSSADGMDPTPVPTAAPTTASPTPLEESTGEPPSDQSPAFDTAPDTSGDFGEGVSTPEAMRTGGHEGFDRIVLEFSGDGTPGWTAEWVETAGQLGSGNQVATSPAQLDVTIHGTTWQGAGITSTSTQSPGGLEVVYAGAFESNSQMVIGADSQKPYRIFLLEAPTRLVIDVETN